MHLTSSHVALLPGGDIGLGLTNHEGAPVARLFLRFANAEVSRAFVQQLPLEQVRKVLVMRALLAAISVREIRHMVYVLAGLDLSSDRVLGTPSDPRHCADSRFPSTMRTPGAQMLTSAQYFFRA